ncbi:hypothetical protein EON62_01290 [archaeon]|nr:MAG: hypothetical protein EON62_01290 [archaeon]
MHAPAADSASSSSTASAGVRAVLESAKQQGNDAVAHRRYDVAVKCYTDAIAAYDAFMLDRALIVAPQPATRTAAADEALTTTASTTGDAATDASGYTAAPIAGISSTEHAELDAAVARVLANRSHAYLLRKEAAPALADAVRAAEVSGGAWFKPYVRAARAHAALNAHRAAMGAWERARELAPGDKEVQDGYAACCAVLAKVERNTKFDDVPAFVAAFSIVPDMRQRLATLATFWNMSTVPERWRVFTRFLHLVCGDVAVDTSLDPSIVAGPHISQFAADALVALPMNNYVDIHVPEPWQHFYASLPADQRVTLFEECWTKASLTEQKLIMDDLRAFFVPPPAEEQRGSTLADAGAGASSPA